MVSLATLDPDILQIKLSTDHINKVQLNIA